jgi:acylphosphatase
MASPTESRHVFYSGRVQGVGFRYTGRRIAQSHAVTGFVRNLADGRVELVAEGAPADLNRLLDEIAAAMDGYIDDADIQKGPATGKYSSFDVAF